MASTRTILAAAVLALSLAACAAEGADEPSAGAAAGAGDTMAATTPPAAPPPSATGEGADTLSDAQIFSVLDVLNLAEIDPSQLARNQAQNAGLKQYGERMVTDHTMLADSGRALAQRIGVTPAGHPLADGLRAESRAAVQRLQGVQGMDFDTAYAALMVKSHETALATVNDRLLQRAQNAELRTALEQRVRPMVQQHLDEARRLQQSAGAQH